MSEELTRNSFTWYTSFEECIYELEEHEGYEMYRAISRYSLYGEEPRFDIAELSATARMAWRVIFPILRTARANSAKGKKGGRASKTNNPTGVNQYEVKQEVKQEVKEDKGKDKGKDKSFEKDKSFSHSHKSADALNEGESEDDFFDRKEKEFNDYKERCLSESHKSWRTCEENAHKIKGWRAAMRDYASFCRGSSFILQINSLVDFQRIFHYNAKKFLSDEALNECDVIFSEEEFRIANQILSTIKANQDNVVPYRRIDTPTPNVRVEMKSLIDYMKRKGFTVDEVCNVIPGYLFDYKDRYSIINGLLQYDYYAKGDTLEILVSNLRNSSATFE